MIAKLSLAFILSVILFTKSDIIQDEIDLTNIKLKVTAPTCGEFKREDVCNITQTSKTDIKRGCSECLPGEVKWKSIFSNTEFWKSQSLAESSSINNLRFIIDFQGIYSLISMKFTFVNAVRPKILKISLDARDQIKPWIIFVHTTVSKNELSLYQEDPTLTQVKFKQVPKKYYRSFKYFAFCSMKTLIFIKKDTISLEALTNDASAKSIILNFIKPVPIDFDEEKAKSKYGKSWKKSLYYSINQMQIQGRCQCYKHGAKKCIKKMGGYFCVCRNNACGQNCEKCCSPYHHQPWSPEKPCEKCQCHKKSKNCVFNRTVYEEGLAIDENGFRNGAGMCLNCTENTTGNNCEKCIQGYYQKINVSMTSKNPCRKCPCKRSNYMHGSCKAIKNKIKCYCQKGYTGERCLKCKAGYKMNILNGKCEKCKCNKKGTISNLCAKQCKCKERVKNEKCDECVSGTHYFGGQKKRGCFRCFCFSQLLSCKNRGGMPKFVQVSNGWKLCSIHRYSYKIKVKKSLDLKLSYDNYPYITTHEVDKYLNKPERYYFRAPKEYLGNLMPAFGGRLKIYIKLDIDLKDPGAEISGEAIYIQCLTEIYNFKIIYKFQPPYISYEPTLRSQYELRSFRLCTSNSTDLWIKASYFTKQKRVTLLKVQMEKVSPNSEVCECEIGYHGKSCELCDKGYYRKDLTFCYPCNCNNHSSVCEPETGKCLNCTGNTHGDHCELCNPSYYKDGNECKPCACPHFQFQLTDNCIKVDRDKYKCLNCRNNSEGEHCEKCQKYYYGDPIKKIGCKICDCNDNEIECDINGKCTCKPLWYGLKCDKCADKYYPYYHECKPCSCDSYGSKGEICDQQTGNCSCKTGFKGKKCELNTLGGYVKSKKFFKCKCNKHGTVNVDGGSFLCKNGLCQCKPNFSGKTCNQCTIGFYGFPYCIDCRCSNRSKNRQCSDHDGHCDCGYNVEDSICSRCKPDHYWVNNNDCQACNCGIGSTSKTCDMFTGKCKCVENVVGRDCGECQQGYYQLTKSGCKKCKKPCDFGRICDSKSGICVCPPNTTGNLCHKCINSHWNHHKTRGCKKCECSDKGTKRCDPLTGKCLCKPKFAGIKCDMCASSNLMNSQCKWCSCNKDGTKFCDKKTGKCHCKPNVEGEDCSKCKKGYFGINEDYVGGCYKCICYHRKYSYCTRNSLKIEQPILSHKAHLQINPKLKRLRRHNKIIFYGGMDLEYFIEWDYSKLLLVDITRIVTKDSKLEKFFGSVFLVLNITCDKKANGCGRNASEQNPELFIKSYTNSTLAYRPKIKQIGKSDIFSVKLGISDENGDWILQKYMGEMRKSVTRVDSEFLSYDDWRELLMEIITDPKSIKLRLYTNRVKPRDITVQVSISTVEESKNPGPKSVEQCFKCKTKKHKTCKVVEFIKIQVIVTVYVNLNLDDCIIDPHGKNCTKCSEGYYRLGNTSKCTPCLCPNSFRINAKSCTKTQHNFICNCKSEFTGKYCETCKPGYYQNMTDTKNYCTPCNCQKKYANSLKCNLKSGQCDCKPQYTGLTCNKCKNGKIMFEGDCYDCSDNGCSKTFESLLTDEDNTTQSVRVLFGLTLNNTKRTIEKYNSAKYTLEKFHKAKNEVQKNNELKLQDIGVIISIMEKSDTIYENHRNTKETLESYIDMYKERLQKPSTIPELQMNLRVIASKIKMKLSKHQTSFYNLKTNAIISKYDDVVRRLLNLKKLELKNKPFKKIIEDQLKQYKIMSEMVDVYSKEINQFYNDNYEFVKSYKNEDKSSVRNKEKLDKFIYMRLKIEAFLTEYLSEDRMIRQPNESLTMTNELKILHKNMKADKDLMKKLDYLLQLENTMKNYSQFTEALFDLNTKIPTDYKAERELIPFYNNLSNCSIKVQQNLKNHLSEITNCNTISKEVDKTHKNSKFNSLEFTKTVLNFTEIWKNIKNDLHLIDRKENDNYLLQMVDSGKNLSQIKSEFADNLRNINNVTFKLNMPDEFEKFEYDAINISNIIYEMNETVKLYQKLVQTINKIKNSYYKDVFMNKMSRYKYKFEIMHGTVSKSPEPIRCKNNSIRLYQTYYLHTSFEFELKFYFKPETFKESLILFGFDYSTDLMTLFAITMNSTSVRFIWSTRNRITYKMEINNISFIQENYQLEIKLIADNYEMKLGFNNNYRTESFNSTTNFKNIIISSDSFISVGGIQKDFFDRKNVKTHPLYQKLVKQYHNKGYEGCIFHMYIQGKKFGLSDFIQSGMPDNNYTNYVLGGKDFNCGVNISKLSDENPYKIPYRGNLNKSKKPDLCCLFMGHGYAKIVLSDMNNCHRYKSTFKQLYVEPYLFLDGKSIFVMVYFEPKSQSGIHIYKYRDTYYRKEWVKNQCFYNTDIRLDGDNINWMDGVDCDVNFDYCNTKAFMYLGRFGERDNSIKFLSEKIQTDASFVGWIILNALYNVFPMTRSVRNIPKSMYKDSFPHYSLFYHRIGYFKIFENAYGYSRVSMMLGFTMLIQFKSFITIIVINEESENPIYVKIADYKLRIYSTYINFDLKFNERQSNHFSIELASNKIIWTMDDSYHIHYIEANKNTLKINSMILSNNYVHFYIYSLNLDNKLENMDKNKNKNKNRRELFLTDPPTILEPLEKPEKKVIKETRLKFDKPLFLELNLEKKFSLKKKKYTMWFSFKPKPTKYNSFLFMLEVFGRVYVLLLRADLKYIIFSSLHSGNVLNFIYEFPLYFHTEYYHTIQIKTSMNYLWYEEKEFQSLDLSVDGSHFLYHTNISRLQEVNVSTVFPEWDSKYEGKKLKKFDGCASILQDYPPRIITNDKARMCDSNLNELTKVYKFISKNSKSASIKLQPGYFTNTSSVIKIKLRIQYRCIYCSGMLLMGGYKNNHHIIYFIDGTPQFELSGMGYRGPSKSSTLDYEAEFMKDMHTARINKGVKLYSDEMKTMTNPEFSFGVISGQTSERELFDGCILGVQVRGSDNKWKNWEFEPSQFFEQGHC